VSTPSLIAAVETAHTRYLNEAVQLTEYAKSKNLQIPAVTGRSATTVDAHSVEQWLATMQQKLQRPGDTASSGGEGSVHTPVVLDGHALRQELLDRQLVGRTAKAFEYSATMGLTPSVNAADGPPSSVSTPGSQLSFTARKTAATQSVPPASSSTLSRSAGARRLAKLKTRLDVASSAAAPGTAVRRSNDGPRLIRGHAPGDRRGF